MTVERTDAAFPVQWDDAADAQLSWFFDITHTPDVMTPLGFDLYYGPFILGFGWTRVCHVNYYVYMAQTDRAVARSTRPDPAQLDLGRLAEAGERWRNEIIPETVGHAEYYRDTDFDAMPADRLESEIEKLRELRVRQGELHNKAMRPWGLTMNLLIDTYKELTGGDDLGAVRLVQGYGNRSVDAGTGLWELSRLASAAPAVRERVLDVDGTAARERLASLASEPSAGPFLEAFAGFLDEFGWRSELFEFAKPTWLEDPAIPLQQLRLYLEMPDYDPAAEQRKLAQEREAALQETMGRLDAADRERMQGVVDVARGVVSIQEDHNYYIDQRLAMMPRRLALAAGRRLAGSGALDDGGDVFYLRADELLAALRGKLEDPRGTVQRCKAQMARWAQVTPPPHVGEPPREDLPAPSPMMASLRSERRNELRGNGASAGVARGPARVLMGLAEAGRLKPGDVLVARTTMPPWTPLFAVACAVITETGGVLSHAAVVAREYGIPAVLGVSEATRLIRDGQLLEVDGNSGSVRLLA